MKRFANSKKCPEHLESLYDQAQKEAEKTARSQLIIKFNGDNRIVSSLKTGSIDHTWSVIRSLDPKAVFHGCIVVIS